MYCYDKMKDLIGIGFHAGALVNGKNYNNLDHSSINDINYLQSFIVLDLTKVLEVVNEIGKSARAVDLLACRHHGLG